MSGPSGLTLAEVVGDAEAFLGGLAGTSDTVAAVRMNDGERWALIDLEEGDVADVHTLEQMDAFIILPQPLVARGERDDLLSALEALLAQLTIDDLDGRMGRVVHTAEQALKRAKGEA